MKKVLVISYFWPPSGKASLHWPLFVMKHLSGRNWQPVILTVDEDTFSHKDESLLKEVRPEWMVIKTPAHEPFSLYRKLVGKSPQEQLVASEAISLSNRSLRHRLAIWIRMNLFVPDARIGWYFSAISRGKKLLKETKIDAIVSIGPPHSAHLIGKGLSTSFGVPHIPVFIDPWADIVYYKNFSRSRLTVSADRYLERKVLEHAASAVFVTGSMREEYCKRYRWLSQKSEVMYWGYNEENFKKAAGRKKQRREKILLHAGNIFDYQNPPGLWKNIAGEMRRGKKIRIRFIGTVSPGITKAIDEAGLTDVTEYAGFLSYPDAVKEMMNASYLLVCATEKRHIPGKLFEYLRAGRPIIAFGDDNTEVGNILREAHAGILLPYSYHRGDIFARLKSVRPDASSVKKYSRERIAKQLSRLLDTLTAKN